MWSTNICASASGAKETVWCIGRVRRRRGLERYDKMWRAGMGLACKVLPELGNANSCAVIKQARTPSTASCPHQGHSDMWVSCVTLRTGLSLFVITTASQTSFRLWPFLPNQLFSCFMVPCKVLSSQSAFNSELICLWGVLGVSGSLRRWTCKCNIPGWSQAADLCCIPLLLPFITCQSTF